jgi:two-component system sensor histidine kinase TctE
MAAVGKDIDLSLEAEQEIMVAGNALLLHELLANLLDNAIRYTPEGGQVNIRIAQQQDALLLAVEDSGPGIPAEERERAFQRFYRGRREAGDGVGSGLGLAIVANIAARHGAGVALLDSALGGLRVELRFPMPRSDADARS